jgi:hypothetical protein
MYVVRMWDTMWDCVGSVGCYMCDAPRSVVCGSYVCGMYVVCGVSTKAIYFQFYYDDNVTITIMLILLVNTDSQKNKPGGQAATENSLFEYFF